MTVSRFDIQFVKVFVFPKVPTRFRLRRLLKGHVATATVNRTFQSSMKSVFSVKPLHCAALRARQYSSPVGTPLPRVPVVMQQSWFDSDFLLRIVLDEFFDPHRRWNFHWTHRRGADR